MKKLISVILLSFLLPMMAVAREYVSLESMPTTSDDALWHRHGKTLAAPCTYWSTDQHGDSVLLSGRMWLPRSGRAERIILCPHYTITANSECPSECTPMEARLTSEKYIFLMPDYIGYGVSVDRIHPYLDVHLTVRNTIDMLMAAQHYLAATNQLPLSDSILIVGFSQGSAVAVGVLEELERTNAFPVKKCYASSGPYDVAATYDLCVEHDYIGLAFVVPAFVLGTNEAYDLGVHADTIFTPWMMQRYQYALCKEHKVVPTALRLGKGRLSKYLSPAGLDKSKGEQKRLYEGYLRSSLVHIYGGDTVMSDWRPRTPIYLMHSMNDDLVNYECAENLRTMLERNGATEVEYDFGRYGGHLSSLLRFLRKMKSEL